MVTEETNVPAPVFRARTRKDFDALLTEPMIIRPINRYWRRFLPNLLIPIGETKAMALLPPNPIITYKGEKVTRVCRTIILDKSTMEINFLMQ